MPRQMCGGGKARGKHSRAGRCPCRRGRAEVARCGGIVIQQPKADRPQRTQQSHQHRISAGVIFQAALKQQKQNCLGQPGLASAGVSAMCRVDH